MAESKIKYSSTLKDLQEILCIGMYVDQFQDFLTENLREDDKGMTKTNFQVYICYFIK